MKDLVLNLNKGLLIDTNLLILLITGYYDKSYIKKFKRTAKYSIEDFENLSKIVDGFNNIVTTPHILAEVSNLCINRKGPDDSNNTGFENFIKVLIDTIYQLKEVYLEKNSILILDYFDYLGVTDSAIIEIARKNKYNVITDDAGVFRMLSKFKIPVININHLREI